MNHFYIRLKIKKQPIEHIYPALSFNRNDIFENNSGVCPLGDVI